MIKKMLMILCTIVLVFAITGCGPTKEKENNNGQKQKEQNENNKEQNNSNNNNVGSVWNKAGTWEEKKITKKQLEDFFNNYIEKNKKNYKDSFFFEEFNSYSGDVRIFFFIYFYFSRLILFFQEEK